VLDAGDAVAIGVETWHIEAVLRAVRERLC
jgi:hypothetical protein